MTEKSFDANWRILPPIASAMNASSQNHSAVQGQRRRVRLSGKKPVRGSKIRISQWQPDGAKRLDCGDFSTAFCTPATNRFTEIIVRPKAPLKPAQSRRFAIDSVAVHFEDIP